MSDIPFDPYKRELKFCADVMCAYLEGYSQVGYEELLKMCERVLPLDKMSHEKIAEIFDVPVANVEALASGMSVAEVMKTRAGEEYIANKVRRLIAEDGEIVEKAEKCGMREFAKYRAKLEKLGLGMFL